MADIDMLELLQVVNDLTQRNTLEVQIKSDCDCVWVRSHVLEAHCLSVPTVTARHALESLNLRSVASVLPTPLLNMRRTTVGALFLIGTTDFESKVEVPRCDLLTQILGEEYAVNVLASHLSINEVWTLARPVQTLTKNQIRTVARLRFDAVGVLVDTLDLIPVREHFPSPNLPRFQLNRQIPNHRAVPIDINR
jgi:hypothetical protein